ncbi:MAG: AAA family ATPase [Nostoc sp. NOS(2021)]|uniref:ATP-binding sensor histidine kinase n=1 Tax=Nostoc sp. NOS(2021) TaxID=2815407 RepID=UPI0025DEC466|nr:AAA family ATPase [Nostoc sp. NOS(2021)]MBN3899231.1 AAA family ATPase [Nostoc sp. NOS(2021)]
MSAKVDGTVTIAGYQMIEQLYSGSRTQVYRAVREGDRLPVVIKLLKREYPTFSELVQFRNQYAIAKNLDISPIIKPYSLEAHHNGYALVMEDFGGISLREFTAGRLLTLEQFLATALQLIDTLHPLHQQRVIHKDIKPANILIHPDTKQIKLIDFSIASLLPRETQEIQSINGLEGTLAYLSPEQTGRMNRGIDYRSDFYSLGVTFFELLSGELPFESHDPMELVHCHIAKLPPFVCDLNPDLPLMLGEIVRKLMAKNAEDRYQSALGLKHDLVTCLEQWRETGKHTWFELGQRDISDRFLIREKLYGRESEVQTLLEAFGHVANGGCELMLVAGFSGVGKTAVVNEVHKPIVRWNGYFIKGKYDQFNRNIPLSAFVQAFRDLMAQLLSESDTQLEQWQSKILAAVGENGQVLIEVIPELEQMIGKQPAIAELSGSAAQNRFHLLFQNFIQVFTTREHPLVMFLDDLQWADSASLNLLKLLMGSNRGYLFIIGAYRDNEVFAAHSLMLTLDEIEKASSGVNTLTLVPLSQADVNQLIADSLSCATGLALPLTELVYQKAKGNPFFTTQFLKALHEDGLITFDWEAGFWQCDVGQVRSLALTDDVVEFMAQQLQKLPNNTQDVLKLAACIGNQFDLATLAIVYEKSQTETASDLWKALQEGFIIPTNEVYKFYQTEASAATVQTVQKVDTCVYKFLHDRVQQAAYFLIPEEQKQATHLKIGQLLFSAISQTGKDEKIFEIVNQLNKGADLIDSETEREGLAKLNLAAAQRAKSATAYVAAIEYATKGIQLLTASCWQQCYDITLALHDLAAEVACLSGDFRQMEQIVERVLQNARQLLDKVKVYEVRILADVAQSQQPQAIKTALSALKLFGVLFPEQPTEADNTQSLQQTEDILKGKDWADLLELPEMTDLQALAVMRILATVTAAVYQAVPELLPLIVCKQVRLSVEYGNAAVSAQTYAWYGVILCVIGEIDLGDRVGQLAMGLLSRFDSKEFKASTINMVYPFVKPWKHHIQESLAPLLDGYHTGLEMGTLEYAAYCAYNYCSLSFFIGKDLSILESEIKIYSQALAQLKQEVAHNYLRVFYQSVLNLLGQSECPWKIQGVIYDEQMMLPLHQKANDLYAMGTLYINKLILCCLFNEWEQAIKVAVYAKQYLSGVSGCFMVPVFHFYDSLTHLAIVANAQGREYASLPQEVVDNQKKLKQWANHAPTNHLHRFYLVEAEQYRVLGQMYEAMDYYDRAIASAKENGYIQEEALANELAAKFYLNWGKKRIAQSYMTEAYYSYAHWGAKAKVADLERRYPQLLAPILEQTRSPFSTNETIFTLGSVTSTSSATSSSSSLFVALDFATILKASQTLSGEIELEKLLSALLHIVIENAGADKCVFMLLESGGLLIQALAQLSPGVASVQNKGIAQVDFYPMLLNPQPVEDSVDVPVGLINTVKRSLKPAVIIDATVHPQLINDPYIQQQQPKSILCCPILHQGKLLGILYLENNVATGAFTSDRVELLNLLCAQAAISLENARLYRNSQNYAQQLTQSLAKLQASEIRFQNLANNIPGMVYQFRIAADGSTSTPYVSSGCIDLYGLAPELVMAGTHSLYDMNHPDDQPAIVQAIAYSAQTLTPFDVECRIILPSGTVKWIQSLARPERQADGAILWDGVMIDISDVYNELRLRKEAEASLAKEREFLNAIIHNITDGIVVCDASGKLTLFNNATREFHGLPVESLPAEQWAEHFSLYQADGQTPLSITEIPLFRALQGEIVENAEMVIAPKHGSTRILLASGQAIFDPLGNKVGAVVVMRDISDRKLAVLALQQKSLDLQQALNDLQNAQLQMVQSEKMSALGNLVAGVAHEMNNPLGFISASLKQAKPTIADIVEHLRLYQESLPKKSEEILHHAEEIDLDYSLSDLPKIIDSMSMACDRLKNISTSLRTFSRADRDYKVPFNIHDGIDSTILILKHRLKANEQRPAIEIVTNYGNLPQVECFPGQLNQVFMNLLANAIDALDESNTGRSYEEIKANPNCITITTSVENNLVKIAIADNGQGMSEEVKLKIFDHLFTTKGVGKGTGLGLAIARQIVESTHSGKLSFNSLLGNGTEFIIEIPV